MASDATPASGAGFQIVDEDGCRRLYFGPNHLQSEMSLDDPYALSLGYTRRMMASLLFQPRPKHVVIAGLGGGSMPKFLWKQFPNLRLTVLELDPRVIAAAPRFEVPVGDPRLAIIEGDACRWLLDSREKYDLALLDVYDDEGVAGGFCDAALFAAIRARLRPGGVLSMNLLVGLERLRDYRAAVESAFGSTLTIKVAKDGNHVLFAFATPPAVFDWVRLAADAKKLRAKTGIDLPAYLRALRRAQERDGEDEPEDDGYVRMLG